MNGTQAQCLKKLVIELVKAAVAESWSGGGDPADIPALEAQLALAQAKLDHYINHLVTTRV